jgi:hypothetical protein
MVTDFKLEKSPSVSPILPPAVVKVLLRVGIAFKIGAAQTGSGFAASETTVVVVVVVLVHVQDAVTVTFAVGVREPEFPGEPFDQLPCRQPDF